MWDRKKKLAVQGVGKKGKPGILFGGGGEEFQQIQLRTDRTGIWGR